MPRDEFITLVRSCASVGQVLAHFGFKNKGGNNRTVFERIAHEKIVLEPGTYGRGLRSNAGRKFGPSASRAPDAAIFVADSPHSRAVARKRVITDNLLPYVCAVCGNKGIWLGRLLSLVLDHINGKPNDHRLKNLRFLCPNCNSQTDTFAGRANSKQRKLEL